MVFKVVARDILGCYSVFLGISYMYKRYTCYATSVGFSLVSLLFIILLLRALNQEPKRVREKLFVLLSKMHLYILFHELSISFLFFLVGCLYPVDMKKSFYVTEKLSLVSNKICKDFLRLSFMFLKCLCRVFPWSNLIFYINYSIII